MRKGCLAALTLIGLAVAQARPVGAQEQTASIVGVVRDSGGGVVPQAAVKVTRVGGLTVEAATDGEGRYHFPALAPGVFEVTAEVTGFAPARVENVQLLLGQRFDIPITLERGALSETIDVRAESPLIAITQSVRATSFRSEEIQKLPNGRDFTDVVAQVSGANPEPDVSTWRGFISIDGSSGAENRVIVDGAETTDVGFGVVPRPVPTDFLDEIQVKSSGYTAEFGGSTGGVINAVTRSGTSEWHGDALLYWEADWLDARNAPTLQLDPEDSSRAEHVTFPKDDYHGLEPGFTLGGPLLRDRLWFFAGYLPRFEPIRRTAPFTDGTTGTLLQDWRWQRAVATLTAQLGSQWRMHASYSLGRERRDGLLQEANGTSAADAAYDELLIQPAWGLSGSLDWTPSGSFHSNLRGTYSLSGGYLDEVYQGDLLWWATSSEGVPGVPPQYQQPTDHQNVQSNWGGDGERHRRVGLQWDAGLFFSGAGSHHLEAGIQLDRRMLDLDWGQSGNILGLFWGQAFAGERGPFGYYYVISNIVDPNRGNLFSGKARVDNLGLFLQDAWAVSPRLTLNLGLRTENEHVPSFSRDPAIPETAIRFGFRDKLAPRLGFAWDATGDGKTKLYGSWGVFYDVMRLNLPVQEGARFFSIGWYTLDDPDISHIQDNDRCPPDCPGRPILHLDILTGTPINDPENPDLSIDPALKPMKVQEAVVGLEREIAPNLSLSARFIHKQLDRAVEDVGSRDEAGQQSYTIANPGFGSVASFVPVGGSAPISYPRSRRDYDALELGLHRRMADGWSGRFVYLWSRLHGNDWGLANSDFGQLAPNWNRTFDSPMMGFDQNAQPVYGLLATDRTHQIKAQLVWDFAFGTTVGASWFAWSGVPLTRSAGFVPGEQFPVFYLGRESDGRMPFRSRLDLQLQHRIRLGDRMQLNLTVTAFNLLDQVAPTDAWDGVLFPGQAIELEEADFFAGFDTEQLIEEQGLVRDPRFLMDRAFQAPRTIRLAARLSF